MWCWRRLLRVLPKSNHSILKEINPEYSLEELMLKLKLQHFGHLRQRTDSLEKILMLGKTEGGRRRGCQRTRCWMDMSLRSPVSWWWTGKPGMLQSIGLKRVRKDWATELIFKSLSKSRKSVSCSVISWTVARLPCPWNTPGKRTGVGCHTLIQEIFSTQGMNPGLPHCRQILYRLSHQGSIWTIWSCVKINMKRKG